LHDTHAELFTMVTILVQRRAPAIRFATDRTRETAFSRVVQCCADMGGMTREMLTDRDPAFCIGSTSDGRAILAPEWVDLAALLGVVPRACKPYRAKTKGKVERMVRELKEGFIPCIDRLLGVKHRRRRAGANVQRDRSKRRGRMPADETCSFDPGTGFSHCTTKPSDLEDRIFITCALAVPDLFLDGIPEWIYLGLEGAADTWDWTHRWSL
jgi:hypothetical protein